MGRAAERGVSLLEAMIAIAIVGIVVAASSQFFGNAFVSQGADHMRSLRDQIATAIQAEIVNPATLADSLAVGYGTAGFEGNTRLADCISPLRPCGVTRPGTQVSFQLVRRIAAPGGFTTARLAGSTSSPVFYNAKGAAENCAPGRACPFVARAFFWATCPQPTGAPMAAAPAACTNPESINVRFQVSQSYNPGLAGTTGSQFLRLESVPPGVPGVSPNPFADNPSEFAWSIPAKDIRLRAQDDCKGRPEPNAYQAGVDKFGNAICKCTTEEIPGSRATDPMRLGRPLCRGKTCPKDQAMVGFRTNAATGAIEPICEVARECCWSRPFADAGDGSRKGGQGPGFSSGVDCGDSARMVRITYGSCEVQRRKKDTQDLYSFCSGGTATCCRQVIAADGPAATGVCGPL